jgi:uncharacterized protein YraI
MNRRKAVFCLRYNWPVMTKALPILILIGILMSTGCGVEQTPLPIPSPVGVVTATLPPTPTASPTAPPITSTPIPTLPPVEGTTTTQLNVRAEPSTNAASLGLLPIFSKIQIVGKDVGGNWYQILYEQGPGGRGWLTTQYVQVAAGVEIPTLGGGAGPGSAPNGVVIQQINVRSGPGTDFNSLGTLNPQDGVTLTGKNSGGTWLQIEFASGPEERGWLAAAYVQTSAAADLPIVSEAGEVVGTGTPTGIPPTSTPTLMAAFDDGDSADEPAVNLAFSPNGSSGLQYTSDLSAPQGDAEDWVRFTPYLSKTSLKLTCTGNGSLRVELWQNGGVLPDWTPLICGADAILNLTAGQAYLLRLKASNTTGNLEAARYTLILATVR